MKFKDYYATLGVEREASNDEIKKAFRKLARKYHPDVAKDQESDHKFKEINEAYQTLSDQEKREAYDQLGRHSPGEEFRPSPEWDSRFWQDGVSQGGGSQGGGVPTGAQTIDLADLFEQMGFRSVHQGRSGEAAFSRRGQDYEVATTISLEDAARGSEVALDLGVPEMGRDGTLHRVSKTVRLRVPKGVIDGERLRVAGRGAAGIGKGPAGDLYLTIRLQPHRLFKAVGHDLYLEVPITPSEAVLGGDIEVPSLDGRLTLNVKPGTRGGQTLRLVGKGLPKRKQGSGNLYCVLQIVTPPALSDRERELYQELGELSTFQPRLHLQDGPKGGQSNG